MRKSIAVMINPSANVLLESDLPSVNKFFYLLTVTVSKCYACQFPCDQLHGFCLC